MFLGELVYRLDTIRGIGPGAVKSLSRLGITVVRELLRHYPRDYEDRTRPVPIRDYRLGKVCADVTVLGHEWFGAGYMKTLKIIVEDDTGRASLLCFHRPFLAKQLPVGASVRIVGNFFYKYGEIQASAFEVDSGGGGGILPVYPLCEGLSQQALRRHVQGALSLYGADLDDEIPASIVERDGLLSKAAAMRAIHFPVSYAEYGQAKKTLVYEELFYLELAIAQRAALRKDALRKDALRKAALRKAELQKAALSAAGGAAGGRGERGLSPMQERLVERLPFSLTAGQRDVIGEINADMDSAVPPARLIQGDVGSGKTLVAFLACLKAVEQGGQAALMAPTELLGRQHAESAARFLEPLGIRIAFLTGNITAKGRSRLLAALAAGDIDLVAGTHALFSASTVYKNLRLVVVDEQHRFGVIQRKAIMEKGENPGLIMMSATPIPRTLALTVFGDLDVSVIRDMPPGRKPVKTHLAKTSNAGKVYDFVRKELAAGHQAYFVYPLIEAGSPDSGADGSGGTNESGWQGGLKDAETMAERLAKEVFPEYEVALIHSRLDDDQKRAVMDRFRAGEIAVLAATSVVEVGVDVPNATCMVVEHAERFGLAALHQLRGRVGRSSVQSYCFLVYSDQDVKPGLEGMNPELLREEDRSREGKRLMVMLENNDGFVIAEKDLVFRGPGQITGLAQSGFLGLGIADPLCDAAELERARADAFAFAAADPALAKPEHRPVREVLERCRPFEEAAL